MDEIQTERVGKNEALFRQVNERLTGINEAFSEVIDEFSVVCECGNIECTEQIAIEPGAYERVRDDATLFIVRPSHHLPDVEEVVDRRQDEYAVVRKPPGLPATIAEATDPRSDG